MPHRFERPGPQLALLSFLAIACLLPFADKAFHIDDTVFLWIAQQIQSDPLDFYGFEANWTGTSRAFYEHANVPPLASYYATLWGLLFGWQERALHLGFLLPALVALWGTFGLARRLSADGLTAALATLCTPGFLVSSTTIMADSLVLAFWVWAVLLWDRGLREDRPAEGFAAALLVGLCGLTKFHGISLLPLLALHGALIRGRIGVWLLPLLVPFSMFVAYHLLFTDLYGRSPFLDAAAYTGDYRQLTPAWLGAKVLAALAFTGGCAATAATFAPLLWTPRQLVAGLSAAAIGAAALNQVGGQWSALHLPAAFGLASMSQLALWAVVGISVIGLALRDWRRSRDAESVLLLFWLGGIFFFAAVLNWSVNARSVLPAVPAVGILIARALHFAPSTAMASRLGPWAVAAGLGAALALSLTVSWADHRLAASAREAAAEIARRYASHAGDVWFSGHWGFQYYAEREGARPLDRRRHEIRRGDLIVEPSNNSFLIRQPLWAAVLEERIAIPVPSWVTTMNGSVGAGFYASTFGPLPFVFGDVPEETYSVLRASRNVRP